MEARIIDLPPDTLLEHKLALFRDINRDYESAKERVTYLGGWLMELSGEIVLLRTDARSLQDENGQLHLFEREYGQLL